VIIVKFNNCTYEIISHHMYGFEWFSILASVLLLLSSLLKYCKRKYCKKKKIRNFLFCVDFLRKREKSYG
jgi:hypothetical protein